MVRKLVAGLGALALVLVLAGCLPTNEENVFLRSINATRQAKGLPALTWDDGPTHAVAQSWSKQMAEAGKLSHPTDLTAGIPAGWKHLGQNVGNGPDLEQLAKAFIASPHHLANMLNPLFTRVSVGVLKQGQLWWVTEDFVG
ncbi:MAG: hypothetical protein JWN67_666 [Actinomycetia bacterium]|nr:hypothetical protein [Actinomycetes bacterium]